MKIEVILLVISVLLLISLTINIFNLAKQPPTQLHQPIRFQTFVINLKHRVDRKNSAIIQLKRLGITDPVFIKAINAKSLDKQASSGEAQLISNAEIACGLSHISVWKRIVKKKTPLSLIVEDDIVIPEEISYLDIQRRIADSIGAGIIFLGYCGQAPVYRADHNKASTIRGKAVCLHAYLLTLSGAKSLLKLTKRWRYDIPIDWLTEKWCDTHLCFLSSSKTNPRPDYFGRGIIFQNHNLGTNIEYKMKNQQTGFIRDIPSARFR